MKRVRIGFLAASMLIWAPLASSASTSLSATGQEPRSYVEELNSSVSLFESGGRSLVESVLDLAFEHQLPTGLEYVDREAVERPIALRLRNKSVREILNVVVQKHGAAMWSVTVPPQELSTFQHKMWRVYYLYATFKSMVLDQLRSLFPAK